MQEFMRQLVRKRRNLVGRRLARKQRDATAARSAACRRDLGRVFNGNSLRSREAAKTFAIFGRVTVHDSDVRQFPAVGLADIEHIGSPKPCDGSRSLVSLLVVLRLPADDGSKNQ